MTAAIATLVEIDSREQSPSSTPDADGLARIRTELVNTFLEHMNVAQILYCLLCGYQDYPEVVASDVDFMVHSNNAEQIAPLMLEVARRCGALLVQAIRHETGACYFVLAKQQGVAVAYLQPDCTIDYRREGRLWLEAEPVLARRRHCKSFRVPAIADEFLYYLIKKVLKQSARREEIQRITALYSSCPEECSEGIRRFWSPETTRSIVTALLRQDEAWFRLHLPSLLAELRASNPMENWWRRALQYWREMRRRMERVMNPTGLTIGVRGGTQEQREAFTRALEENLRPAFRRTMIRDEAAGDGVRSAVTIWLAKVRSTLVIRQSTTAKTVLALRDEIRFVLPQEGDLESATHVVLEYLALRLRKRMQKKWPPSLAIQAGE